MKNKAKCKLCESVIESFHVTDYVMCKCGEIAVDGGEALYCYAKNFENFIRVDDEGKEVSVSVKDNVLSQKTETETPKRTKNEVLSTVKEMISQIESMPANAMTASLNHYDYLSLLLLLSSALELED